MLANRVQLCTNCGLHGHIFRNCGAPVTSYGVIAMRFGVQYKHDTIQFLLIKRKDSLSFIELIRGKYNLNDQEYIGILLENMTQSEQQRLRTDSFEQIWQDIWGAVSKLQSHKNDYKKSEERFLLLRPYLDTLLTKHASTWTEPEWGFPKGRRNSYEKDVHCAIREFIEETGLNESEFTMIHNTKSITESYIGSNQINYCHKYYLAVCKPSTEVRVDHNNVHMVREIGDIQWLSFDEAFAKIRPGNIEKREILLKAKKIMSQFHLVDTTAPVQA
jgi:8-oxo-dGTP pyrophosphatase MutT (NUDIX family)